MCELTNVWVKGAGTSFKVKADIEDDIDDLKTKIVEMKLCDVIDEFSLFYCDDVKTHIPENTKNSQLKTTNPTYPLLLSRIPGIRG